MCNSLTMLFDWKILGKKEMYIPYNTNRELVPTKDSEVMGPHYLNPNYIRWELHRVWVLEADLAQGQRDQVHKGLYYVDEDSWIPVLADRWDSSGRLWKTVWNLPIVAPDLPAETTESFGFYDLISGVWYGTMLNETDLQIRVLPDYPKNFFSPDTLTQGALR